MVAVEDVLTDSLSATLSLWFEPRFDHPFLNLQTIVVSEDVKALPKRWIDDVQIEEGLFGADQGDFFGDGGPVAATWSVEEGRQRLQDALRRLELPEDNMAHSNVSRMNRHELAVEKRRVKQELKRYDAEFRRQFSRLPAHSEKEPMRPLYVYYRRLKTMISQAEQNKHGRRGTGSGDEGLGLLFGPRESLTTIPDTDETPRTGDGRPGISVEEQVSALEARIESLQSEKSAVRAKLQAFQEKFVHENSRKIRFHKDILPIEREYRMYKNLKEEIMKAEAQLRDLR